MIVLLLSAATASATRWGHPVVRQRRRCHAALTAHSSELEQAAARVHEAAAAFGPVHRQAAIEYTQAILEDGPCALENLLDRQVALFDDTDACLPLRRAMSSLQTLVAGRSTGSSWLRLVSGLDVRLEQAVVEVRALSAEFGSRHARAAVEWTNKVVQADAASPLDLGSTDPILTNAALLEQRVPLFDECPLAADGSELPAGDELREALDVLVAKCEQRALAAAAASAPAVVVDLAEADRLLRKVAPARVEVWSAGDNMPPRLAEMGCDAQLWDAINDKKALVRLAAEAPHERGRKRLQRLREVLAGDSAAVRAEQRAARRAARRRSPNAPVAATAEAPAKPKAEVAGVGARADEVTAEVVGAVGEGARNTEAAARAAARAARRAARRGGETAAATVKGAGVAEAPTVVLTAAAAAAAAADAAAEAAAEAEAEARTQADADALQAIIAADLAMAKLRRRQQPTSRRKSHGASHVRTSSGVGHDHSEEYRMAIPAQLTEWGMDEVLWRAIKDKNAMRRMAKFGQEERARRRIASLRDTLGMP